MRKLTISDDKKKEIIEEIRHAPVGREEDF